MESKGVNQQPDHILDFRGSISTICLLKMTQIFNQMKSSEILEVTGSDPETRKDMFKVLPKASYEIIHMDVVEKKDYFFKVRIRKR